MLRPELPAVPPGRSHADSRTGAHQGNGRPPDAPSTPPTLSCESWPCRPLLRSPRSRLHRPAGPIATSTPPAQPPDQRIRQPRPATASAPQPAKTAPDRRRADADPPLQRQASATLRSTSQIRRPTSLTTPPTSLMSTHRRKVARLTPSLGFNDIATTPTAITSEAQPPAATTTCHPGRDTLRGLLPFRHWSSRLPHPSEFNQVQYPTGSKPWRRAGHPR